MSDPVIPVPPQLTDCSPAIQKCGMAYLDAFNDGKSSIASGRRDLQSQAHADAVDELESPGFILATYSPAGVDPRKTPTGKTDACTKVKCAMLDVVDENDVDDVGILTAAMLACLSKCSDEEISHFSLHPSGCALDATPTGDPEREAWARRYVAQHIAGGGSTRSKVLTRENGMPRLHIQLL